MEDSERCAELCREDPDCKYFTYYTDQAQVSTLARECHLLSSCHTLLPVPGALTGSQQSDCVCSLPVLPSGGQILQSLPADSEVECLLLCRYSSLCSHYFYHQTIALCKLLANPDTFSPSPSKEVRTGEE